MPKKSFYFTTSVAVVILLAAIYYYSFGRSEVPARQRYVDTFDEEPSVSCTNLVLTAWSNNQLTVDDELKIALNDVLHSRGLTAPVPADQFDDIVSENDSHFKELFSRAKNDFYSRCEEVYLKNFTQCERENRNQSDFLKCWVDGGNTDEQRKLYGSITGDQPLPPLPEGDANDDIGAEPPSESAD